MELIVVFVIVAIVWRLMEAIRTGASGTDVVGPVANPPLAGKSTAYHNHCWRCSTAIDGRADRRCTTCGWFVCAACGACRHGGCSSSSSSSSPSVTVREVHVKEALSANPVQSAVGDPGQRTQEQIRKGDPKWIPKSRCYVCARKKIACFYEGHDDYDDDDDVYVPF